MSPRKACSPCRILRTLPNPVHPAHRLRSLWGACRILRTLQNPAHPAESCAPCRILGTLRTVRTLRILRTLQNPALRTVGLLKEPQKFQIHFLELHVDLSIVDNTELQRARG